MPVHVTWFGHAATQLVSGDTTVLIDPFFTGNALASIAAEAVHPTVIGITHGHGDHVGDAVAIAKRTGALCVANYEITTWLGGQGVANVHPLHIGGGFDFPWGRLELTIAHHGSSLPDGTYGGSPAGILLTLGGKNIYHAGDTGLFYDMKLIGDHGIDLALLPIGDNFTMGPKDALRALELLRPRRVVPLHFDTFDVIRQDSAAWAEAARAALGVEATVLAPGGTLTL